MKQLVKILVVAALIGTLPTSCMDSAITEKNISQPDYIHFNSATTRAAVIDLTALQNDVNGFQVFAKGGANPSGWYADTDNNRIDGLNNYRHAYGQWAFYRPVKWPTEAARYPMSFSAFHPAMLEGMTTTDELSAETNFGVVYTIQGVGRQVDLLSAKATAAVRPATGSVTLSFSHALSRVNFGIIAGKGTIPVIQSLQVINVVDTKVYDFTSDDWVTIPKLTDNAAYYYYGAPGGATIPVFTPAIMDDNTDNAIYAGKHDHHLLLMPQTTASWKPQSGKAPDATSGAYISVTYRMSTGNGTNGNGDPREVGFADAKQHPDYHTSGGGISGPLYVKAGFPLPDKDGFFTWEKGSSYLYNIVLGAHGSCNGYILDDYYYDEKGNRTNLRLIEVRNEGKQTGDKLQDGTIHVKLEIDSWDIQYGGDISPGAVTLTPANVLFDYNEQKPAAQTLTVKCTKGNGSPDPTASWTLTSNQPWLTLSHHTNGNGAATTISGTGTQTVYLFAGVNNTAKVRTATIRLAGATTNNETNVTQNMNFEDVTGGGSLPEAVTSYTGAFWRHNETGERIIKIQVGSKNANTGTWSASVVWLDKKWDAAAGDGIVLATGGSSDPGITWNASNETPGDAEDYQVTGNTTTVGGTVAAGQEITFRIGLQKPFTAYHALTNPARYAVILLSYNENSRHQKIFLRQGEGGDVLYDATKWSPYNVGNYNGPAHVGNTTQFPTQAGYFYQYSYSSSSATPKPYHPVTPVNAVTGWSRPKENPLYTLGNLCPSGYAVPEKDQTSTFVNSTNKAIWGYYADGWFDRRQIVNSPGIKGSTNSAVSTSNEKAAYSGMLFYNTTTHASIFFPAAGFRDYADGKLTNAGNDGMYVANAPINGNVYFMNFWNSGGMLSNYSMSYGYSVRCVRK